MRPADVIVILLYLVATIAAGLVFRGRAESVDEYFTGRGLFRGRLGEVLIGLSIAATFLSGISIIVYVSSAYSDGARIGLGLLCLPISWLVLLRWFLPRYLAAGGRHPYDVVELRLGYGARAGLSAMFFLLRVGWMGVMVYVPTLVILGAFGLGPAWFWPIVLVVGLSSTLYTVVGGIRGVIITDALQFIVILGGMLLIVVLLLARLGLSPAEITADLAARGRLDVLDFSLDPRRPFTFWTVVVGMSVSNLGAYLADQMSLQRYLASGTPEAAHRAFVVNAAGVAGVIITLVVTGLLLSVWYARNPAAEVPAKPDLVLGHFIVRELPPGVAGALIAAILAATMSSMTSAINSLAGVITNDWLPRLGRPRTPGELYRFGRRASLLIGVAATLLSGFAADLGSVLDVSAKVMGAFLGPMLACILFAVGGVAVPRSGILIALAAGVSAGWAVAFSPYASLWVSPVSFSVAGGAGLIARVWFSRAPLPA